MDYILQQMLELWLDALSRDIPANEILFSMNCYGFQQYLCAIENIPGARGLLYAIAVKLDPRQESDVSIVCPTWN